ncbi:MAG: AGE family epimerase/isomerase [Ignavibacteriales bacterium]|nr:AGE family epimerase/isomerase [Ignavibacteriales bacterium]
MKKILLALVFIQCAAAQYVFKSQYLQTPEMNVGYVDSCAKFWMSAYDITDGGFYVNINRQGNQFGSTIKNTLNQSRDAYGFIRAFQMTGDTVYLRYARYALDFMYTHSWDATYGGWYNSINKNGTPSNVSENKTAFYQHYALLGIAAAYEATRDSVDLHWLMKGYDYNESKLWDGDPVNFGYYDYVAANGTNPTDKSFNATVDAVTTHVVPLYLLTGDQKYKTRLLELADNMIHRLASSSASQAIGFAERYTTDWQIKSATIDEKRTIMGHVLKTGWCLARIYELEKDSLFLSTAEQLVQMVLDKGYDHQYGGPYKDYDRITGQMMMYGQDTAKAWWQMEQAMTAGMMLYQLTGKEKYLKMADETNDFFMKYFVDHVYGDVFENTYKNGSLIPAWGTTKGGTGKAAYHSIETGYYTYLYGKLLVKKEPATLHYSFKATGTDHTLRMRPIGVPDNYMKIQSVTHDGNAYTNFDSTNLTLNIPAGTGGIFAVTYKPAASPTGVAERTKYPAQFVLHQNYPNPFNPATTIGFTLQVSGFTTLKIYDVVGREVAILVNGYIVAGTHSVRFNASHLASGIYISRLQANGKQQLKKMILIR